MPEIHDTFDALYKQYKKVFIHSTHSSHTRAGLMKSVPAKTTGVYVIWKKGALSPIYIGSSGKIEKKLKPSGSSIRSRMLGSSTPYHFDTTANQFKYGPTTSGVPPAGYHYAISLSEIEVTCLAVYSPSAPTVLEHLLIQGFINQYHDLPEANQKI